MLLSQTNSSIKITPFYELKLKVGYIY